MHPGLLFSFSQPIATRVDKLLSRVEAQLAIKLFGPDLDVLARKGREIETLVKQVRGTRGVALEKIAGETQLVVRPDREALARYGMAVEEIVSLVSDGIGGTSAGQVIKGNERYDIYVRLEESVRRSADAIRDLLIESPNGGVGCGWAKWQASKSKPGLRKFAATTCNAAPWSSPTWMAATWAAW